MIVFQASTAHEMQAEIVRYIDHLTAIEERAKALATARDKQMRQARINLLSSMRMEINSALI